MDDNTLEKQVKPVTQFVPTTSRPLRGCEGQLERIHIALQTTAESRQGGVMLLESPAGSGKTRLLLEAVTLAERLGFGVVDRFVCGAWQSDETNPVTPEAGRSARINPPQPDRLTAELQTKIDGHLRRGPVLVVLDDAQWADPLVLRTLSTLALKLRATSVLWLFAMRSEEAQSSSNLLLHNLTRDHRTDWLPALEPLSNDAVAELIGDVLDADPGEDVLALGESLGGSPRAVVNLALGLLDENCLRITDGAACLADEPLTSGITSAVASDPNAHLPLPFLRLMHERLDQLSPYTRRVLQVAAVLGPTFSPHDLVEMLGDRPIQILGPVQEALTAGLLTSGPEEFVFQGEPIWRAVLGTVPPLMRSLLHRQAADMILARPDGTPAAAAVHLVHCAQADDSQAITTICEAAERLLPASPQAAAALALRGLEIIGPGRPEHITLATTATAALVRSGNLDRAVEVAEPAVAFRRSAHQGQDPHEDGTWPLHAWLATALLLRGDADAVPRVFRNASPYDVGFARGAGPGPCPVLLRLNVLSHTDETAAVAAAEDVLTAGETHTDGVRAAALNIQAMARWRDGRVDDALDLLDRAAALRGPLTSVWDVDPLWNMAWILIRVRGLDKATAIVETVRRTTDSESNGVLAAIPLALRAWVRFACGDLAEAEADATVGIRSSIEVQMPLCEPHLRAVLVAVALRRGDLALALERLTELEATASGEHDRSCWAMRCLITAQVTAARRGAESALEVLREVRHDPDKRRQLVLEDPTATAWCVRTALAAGDREIATLIATSAEEISAATCSHPAVAAGAAHGRALLDCDSETLAGVAKEYGDPWGAASATEDLGVLVCATDRERAIAAFNDAMAAYDELGAVWDSARVRKRLRRLGVRRRHWNPVARPQTGWDSLTGAEEKVTRLVARGLTNRQVASELFISPHTVGFHLRQIYRKLAIRSRVDLARIVCAPGFQRLRAHHEAAPAAQLGAALRRSS